MSAESDEFLAAVRGYLRVKKKLEQDEVKLDNAKRALDRVATSIVDAMIDNGVSSVNVDGHTLYLRTDRHLNKVQGISSPEAKAYIDDKILEWYISNVDRDLDEAQKDELLSVAREAIFPPNYNASALKSLVFRLMDDHAGDPPEDLDCYFKVYEKTALRVRSS